MVAEPRILLAREGGVATLTLNRPERLNVLDPALARALAEACTALAGDAEVRVVVLEGAGGNFMAGGDIQFFARALREGGVDESIFDDVHGAIRTLRRMPQPVVAGVDGACAGFGVSLLGACDLAVAAEDARFSMAYGNLGVSPDGGSTWSLTRSLGLKRSSELILLGEAMDAGTAQAIGLVNRVVPAEQRPGETQALARRLARGPRLAQAHAKALLQRACDADFDAQLDAEQRAFMECAASADFAEGVTAFLEKRAPAFGP